MILVVMLQVFFFPGGVLGTFALHMESQYNDPTFQVHYEFPPDFRIQISMYGIHLASVPKGCIRLRHW